MQQRGECVIELYDQKNIIWELFCSMFKFLSTYNEEG